MSDTCIFCSIVAGDIPARIVRQDERFVAFHDVDPKASTHVLVVPREHTPDFDAYAAAGAPHAAQLLQFVSDTAAEVGAAGAYRLVVNDGAAADQTVFHLHLHILAGDDLPAFH